MLTQVRKPIRNPRCGQKHVGKISAAVVGLAPGMVSGNETERGEHKDGDHEPVIERSERPVTGIRPPDQREIAMIANVAAINTRKMMRAIVSELILSIASGALASVRKRPIWR